MSSKFFSNLFIVATLWMPPSVYVGTKCYGFDSAPALLPLLPNPYTFAYFSRLMLTALLLVIPFRHHAGLRLL